MDTKRFFGELKRRNVYKVGAAYVVVAWLVIQVATQTFPFFEIPSWVVRLVILLLILGFPVALVIAWAFELTPEGIKRTEDVRQGDSITPHTGRKLVFITAILAACASALLTYQIVRQTGHPSKAAPADAPKSIAVLPFENLSRDPDNAYFAVGVQDEILTRLSKVRDLKVISRTSTQQYQSRPGNLREIAQQLGVSNVLEGSVQRAGDDLRVTVQLINASSDAHVWAETYDRKVSEIFAVQSDVARRVASALEATLTGREQQEIASAGTSNQEAYDAYLRGVTLSTSQSWDDMEHARGAFHRAVELDPKFAAAWAALAGRESFKYFAGAATPAQFALAKEAMEKAMQLAPDASESYAAAGAFYYYCLQNYDQALEMLGKARERAPNDASVIMLTAVVKRRQGHIEESIDLMRHASTLDPRNNDIWVNLARSYRGMRRFSEAHAMFDQARIIEPQSPAVLAQKAEAYMAAGDLDAAEKLLSPLPMNPALEYFDRYVRIFVLRRDFHRAIELWSDAAKAEPESPSRLYRLVEAAYIRTALGGADETRSVFQQAREAVQQERATGDQSVWLREQSIMLAAALGDRETVERDGEALQRDFAKDAWRRGYIEWIVGAAYALLGDADQALPHIERAVAMPAQQGLTAAYLRLDPMWDKIRNDPRFQKLASGSG